MAAFSRRRGRRLAMVGLALLAGSCTDRDAGRAPASSQSSAATAPVAVVDGLAGPEAVRYDPDQDVYFVSNVNGDPAGDANGFISRVGPDGAVLAREFMTGTERSPLHGPRGLWLAGDTLWAADAGGLHAFDRRGGAHLGFVDFSAHEPGFLNDIASGPDGALYVTDTDRSRVFRLAAGEVTVAVDDRALCGPNGITWDARGGRFLLASWDRGPSVQAWRPGTRTIEAVGSPGPGGFDGIELWGDRILVASQSDSTLRELGAGGEGTMLRLPGAPADIGIDMRRGRVAIPMMDRNQVEIWSLPPRSP
jgi:hypothetical protein